MQNRSCEPPLEAGISRLKSAADLFCTLELLRAKVEDNALSRSDLFFRTKQTLQKDYLRKIVTKRFGA